MIKNLKRLMTTILSVVMIFASCSFVVYADYPIFYQRYAADPTVMVYDGRVYIYMTHDVYYPGQTGYMMDDITCISSSDMKNWTDHGEVFKAPGGWSTLTWAPSVVERNGKFYLYFANGGDNIGVAISDTPTGPFIDALGRTLVDDDTPGILKPDDPNFWCFDPCAFIDDDGQAYLYFGGNGYGYSHVIKLADDMISVEGEASSIYVPEFFEASYVHKYNDKYYFSYSRNFNEGPPSIDYAISDSPTSGFEFKGSILPNPPNNRGDNNHQSIFEFNGEWYIAYHNKALSDMNGNWNFERNVCIDKLEYNEDGTIKQVEFTEDGLVQLEYVNPYEKNEAETMAQEYGINTDANAYGGRSVNLIENNDWIRVRGVDFGNGAAAFKAGFTCGFNKGSIELRLDSPDGLLIGTLPVSYADVESGPREKMTTVSSAEGVHDLYFVFKGEDAKDIFRFDYWQFRKKNEEDITCIRAEIDNPKLDITEGKNIADILVTAMYSDGTIKDVTSEAEFITDNSGIVEIKDGTVAGINYGKETINVSYEGKSDKVDVLVKDFSTEVTAKSLSVDKTTIDMLNGLTETYAVTAEFIDGHTEDVTEVAVADYDSDIVEVENGIITARSIGDTTVKFTYKGEKGDAVTATVDVKISNLNPFIQNEAEDYHNQNGVQKESCNEGGQNIGYIENGDWIMYKRVDFGKGAQRFEARVSSATTGGSIELHLDSLDGELIGTLEFSNSGGWQTWITEECEVAEVSGVHDLYMKFVGGSGNLFNVNWWKFINETTEIDPTIQPTATPEAVSGKILTSMAGVTVEDDKLKVSVKIENDTENAVNAQAVLALYDEYGDLADVKLCDINAVSTETVNIDVDFKNQGTYIKVMVWDSIDNIKSLTPMYQYYLN